ncbi:helix-turn-helix transcriptional regulator [Methylobacterium nigriterrae]|uniref:helix-turn-helix transcriptional regulator n=1 Tax=Methylobacterium nigriterrae TaxID=3127512 RepID=UPI003D673C00
MSAAEVAKVLSISKSALWAAAKENKVPPPLKIGPRTTRWCAQSIRTFIEEAQNEAELRANYSRLLPHRRPDCNRAYAGENPAREKA